MNIKQKKMLCIFLLLLLTMTSVTFAFMFKKVWSDDSFIPAVVTCEVYEKLDDTSIGGNTSMIHKGDIKKDIRVKNTGNYPAYIRVMLISYWVNDDGNVVGESSQIPSLSLKENWFKGDDDIYYYQNIVDANAFTGFLSDEIQLEKKMDKEGNVLYQRVDILAEAIQAKPVDATIESWNVKMNEAYQLIPNHE